MLKNKKLVGGGVVAIILVLLIFACSGGGTPSCDSGEVKKQVIERIQSRYKPDFKVELSNIVTESMDKEAKRVECKAESNVVSNAFGFQMPVEPSYTAQRTSDGKLIVKITKELRSF